MKKAFLSIVCLVLVLVMSSCGGGSGSTSVQQLTDQEILVKIYEAMNGPEWSESQGKNWLSENPIGEWGGVKTNDEGRVIALRVQGDGVKGLIPAEIGGLSELEQLNINSKDFDNPSVLPAEIGNLTKLKSLAIFISANSKEDRPVLPDLSALVDLESLYIDGFRGAIPENIGKLSKLRSLRLEGFEGKIPESICELTDLTQLFLETSKQPVGAVPDCIGRLAKLETLKIDYNNVMSAGINQPDGKFPESIWDLENLENLIVRTISNTGGPIPGDKVAKMTKLKTLSIANCGITGPIPAEVFGLSNLKDLSLYKNALTGSIPSEMGNSPKLTYINLYKNQLTGNIPQGVTKCEELHILNLSDNQLTGNIPEGLGKYPDFYTLDFSGNQLSPNIPADLKANPKFSKFKF